MKLSLVRGSLPLEPMTCTRNNPLPPARRSCISNPLHRTNTVLSGRSNRMSAIPPNLSKTPTSESTRGSSSTHTKQRSSAVRTASGTSCNENSLGPAAVIVVSSENLQPCGVSSSFSVASWFSGTALCQVALASAAVTSAPSMTNRPPFQAGCQAPRLPRRAMTSPL